MEGKETRKETSGEEETLLLLTQVCILQKRCLAVRNISAGACSRLQNMWARKLFADTATR